MSIEIKVPAMGESVTEATVSKWFKKEGESGRPRRTASGAGNRQGDGGSALARRCRLDRIHLRPGRRHRASGHAAGRDRRRQGRQGFGRPRRQSRCRQANDKPKRPSRLRQPQPRKPAPKSDAPAMPSAQRISRRDRHSHRLGHLAPAVMAASPRATCWRRWNRAPPSRAANRAAAPSGPRANATARNACRCRACARPSRCV